MLENVRKETLRVVCGDLALQISGSRRMLVDRVHQELQWYKNELVARGRAHQDTLQARRHLLHP